MNVGEAGDGGEPKSRAGNLACRAGVIKLKRIRPYDGRQALACLVIRRQVEGKGKLYAVCTLVGHDLLGDAAELRRGIGEAGQRSLVSATGAADKVVARLGGTLVLSDETFSISRSQRDHAFVL